MDSTQPNESNVAQLPATSPSGVPKNKPGSKIGEIRRWRHCMSGNLWPPPLMYLKKRCDKFRRVVEAAVVNLRGEVTLSDALIIDAAYKHERSSQLAQRFLTDSYDELSPTDRLMFTRESARHAVERNKAIALLNLDSKPSDIYDGTIDKATDGAA